MGTMRTLKGNAQLTETRGADLHLGTGLLGGPGAGAGRAVPLSVLPRG